MIQTEQEAESRSSLQTDFHLSVVYFTFCSLVSLQDTHTHTHKIITFCFGFWDFLLLFETKWKNSGGKKQFFIEKKKFFYKMSRQFVLMCETGWKNSFDRKNYYLFIFLFFPLYLYNLFWPQVDVLDHSLWF